MSRTTLIVSNPPQTEPDVQRAAPLFGLSAAEVRMKANYGLPEIWFADSDAEAINKTATDLRDAGFSISVITGDDLISVPKQAVAQSLTFGESRLIVDLDDAQLEVEYDSPTTGVFCQPQSSGSGTDLRHTPNSLRASLSQAGQFGRRSGPNEGMHELMFGREGRNPSSAFFDIYIESGNSIARASIHQDRSDFSGLPQAQSNSSENMALLLAEFEDRFENATVDKRLVGMRLRRQASISAAPRDEDDSRRRLYSYATTTLSRLLESISVELKDVEETELSSRLAYLTTR